MRLKQRRNVLLPQPDGPISAVTWFSGMTRLMFLSAWLVPYQKSSFSAMALGAFALDALRSSIAMESVAGFRGLDDVRVHCRATHQLIFLRKR